MAGISLKALSFGEPENKARFNSIEHGEPENKARFNSIEQNKDLDLNMYDAFYRNLDPQIGRFWQIDPKPSDSISLYVFAFNNPIKYFDALGDTIGIDFFKLDKSGLSGKKPHDEKGKNDGVFVLYAHSNSNGIQIIENGTKEKTESDPEKINDALKAASPAWADAMKEGKGVTLIINGCNAASEEYYDTYFGAGTIETEVPIAQRLSYESTNPNLTVVAPDGYCTFEAADGKVKVTGVAQVVQSADGSIKNTGQGGFVTYKGGLEVSKVLMPVLHIPRPSKGH